MQKIKQWLTRFMMGRYGNDKLNMYILGVGVVASLLSVLIPVTAVKLLLTTVSYAFLVVALIRCFSRNTYKRYEENRKFLKFLTRAKDREHRYFSCPKCHQTVRVPRKKGKISITCPKCREKFIRKT